MEQTPPAPPEKSLPPESTSEPSPASIPQSTEVTQTPVETEIKIHHREPPPPSSTEPPSTTAIASTTLLSPSVPPPITTTTTTTSPTPSPITTTSSALQPLTTTNSIPSLPSNSNPNPQSMQNIQPRAGTPTPSAFNRPRQQQQSSPFTHFSLPPSPTPPPSATSASSPSLPSSASQLPVQRGGMALGVPAHHPSPVPPLTSAFNSPPFGIGRDVPDSMPSLSSSQVRQPMQGRGISGSLGASSALRPTGVPGHQLRPMQSSIGPPSGLNMQSLTSQVDL